MNILYIGSGFVGACSAAVTADSGHKTLVYDIDKTKIDLLGSFDREKIESCLFEAGLAEMLIRNRENISFTDDYNDAEKFLDNVEVIFMCLPTPEKAGAEGESDLTYYFEAAEKLGKSLVARNRGLQENYVVIVNKSTVPINMVDETQKIMDKHGVKNYGVVSNPEFLVEGKAIEGSVHPDRVVVGAWTESDFTIMRKVYSRFINSAGIKYIEVNPKEAAAGKLVANYVLFNKLGVTFDVVGRMCETFNDLTFEKIRGILTSDPRIGSWGFYDSVYAGGSCFIKDASSLAHQMEEAGANANYVRQTLNSNVFQRDHFYSRATKEAGFDWQNKTVAVLGVAFKQDTNDIRNSGAIDITSHLIDDGVKEIKIYDPAAMPMFKKLFNPEVDPRYSVIKYFESEIEALQNTQACLILTDWPKFRTLDSLIMENCSVPYLIMDGRRMLSASYNLLAEKGFDIIAVGSPTRKRK